MHFVIFTGGILKKGKAVDDAITKADTIIAADSGAETALRYHCQPEAVIGDFDSLAIETKKILEQKGCTFVTSPQEKNETDTELAIQYAIDHRATNISVLGGIEGNRIDHILANIFLGSNLNIPLRFINGNITTWIAKGPAHERIFGKSDDLLSLIPLTNQVTEIQTTHLYYPLKKESLFFGKSRGISNIFMKDSVEVSFKDGIMLFVHIGKI